MPAVIEGFDLPSLRAQFPALDQEVNGRPLVYLDSAATAQKPREVLDAIAQFYERDNANVHRGIHELSRRATENFEDARARIASFMNASEPAEIVWTRGTTEAINLVAGTWALDNVGEDDEILLSTMEHHSNIVPWQLVAERTGAKVRYIEMDDQGRLALDALSDVLGERTKIVSLGHISNALGTVNPIAEITRRVHDVGALIMIDGAQAGPHRPVDVQELGCDFYAISGHKMCGPTGIGVLWARRELLEEMSPYQGGGEMIRIVERDGSTWAEVPHKFEAGTPNIAGAVGMAAAADFLEGVGFDLIAEHERTVVGYAVEQLSQVPGLRIYGPDSLDERSGVISFTLGDAHPHDISTILDSEGVAVRAGHHCAQLVMRHFDIAATARASFYLYNTTDEVDRLVEALDTVRGIFAV